MSRTQETSGAYGQPSRSEIEDFLFHETNLLDEQRFTEWGELFTPDGIYWVPAARDQTDPLNRVSHIYEDALLREIRISRFAKKNAFSLQPMPRSSHLINNVLVHEFDELTGEVSCSCRFIVSQFHRDRETYFSGCCHYKLVQADSRFQINLKRVNLVNCEGMLGDIVVYL